MKIEFTINIRTLKKKGKIRFFVKSFLYHGNDMMEIWTYREKERTS